MSVRPMALADRWYSGNPQELRASIAAYLAQAASEAQLDATPVAIVVPHAGHVWSGVTAAAGYRVAANRGYKRAFVLCPNHRVYVQGIVADVSSAFDTPFGPLEVDLKIIEAWAKEKYIQFSSRAHQAEHAIEIQLPFVSEILGHVQIVPLIIGEISDAEARAFGMVLREAMKAEDLLIISTDLLYYGRDFGFVPFVGMLKNIHDYDARTIEEILKLDGERFSDFALKNPHAACGLGPLRILSYAFPSSKFEAHQLAYTCSAQQTGDCNSSVSYVSLALTAKVDAALS